MAKRKLEHRTPLPQLACLNQVSLDFVFYKNPGHGVIPGKDRDPLTSAALAAGFEGKACLKHNPKSGMTPYARVKISNSRSNAPCTTTAHHTGGSGLKYVNLRAATERERSPCLGST